MTNKILMAMSGGVDSAVAALLLKQQGYAVIGVFLKLNKNINQSLKSAQAICRQLEIPFYSFDLTAEFQKNVIDYFINELENARTPNPCVICNEKIKFGWLFKIAKQLDCDKIATGHYARFQREITNTKCQIPNNNQISKLQITKPKDVNKDQTYFLWKIKSDQLPKIIFPLGDYIKNEVKKIAKKFNLPVAEKKESQDICFVKPSLDKFLDKYIKKLNKPGDIVDKSGNILGRHKGLCYYTIGQRKGLPNLKFKISNLKFAQNRPPIVYVIKLNKVKNQLVVGLEKDLYQKELFGIQYNWLTGQPKFPFKCKAKIRFGQNVQSCVVDKINSQIIKIKFNKPVCAITPGQSVVFYKDKILLGGAIIK